MKEIRSGAIRDARISLPGSKSYTHRFLIAAALSSGWCRIINCLESEDTRCTLQALEQMGVKAKKGPGFYDIQGCGGRLRPVSKPIDVANSGTSMRLLAGVAALGESPYVLTGSSRMQERPVQDLLEGLRQIGVEAVSLNADGCPPIRINGKAGVGGTLSLDCSISSQYLSALLLMAPLTRDGLAIHVNKGPVSKPYIDMTIDVLHRFGINAERREYAYFSVAGGRSYQSGTYTVEPDASQAGYFWAAAAITGAAVTVKAISRTSLQGDVRFLKVLEQMGCRVEDLPEGIAVKGPEAGDLSPVAVSMGDMPDLVPTLAVVAAFARGETIIRDVGHLRAKESDRLAAVQAELVKMGISARTRGDALLIAGGRPNGAEIETYNDHRMAMSFAVAGLRTPGIAIQNEACVAKSFPGFWEVFDRLYERQT